MKINDNTPVIEKMNLQFFGDEEDVIEPDVGMADMLSLLQDDGMFEDDQTPGLEEKPEEKEVEKVEEKPEDNEQESEEKDTEEKPEEGSELNEDDSEMKKLLEKLNDGRMKHNHEKLTYDSIKDLITDAQKGKNYDKKDQENVELREQAEQFETTKTQLGKFERLAKLIGYEIDPFFDVMLSNYFDNAAKANGTTAEFEKKGYDLTLREEGINLKDSSSQKAEKEQEANDKMYASFVKEFPDADVDKLPKEVTDLVKEGKDINLVYAKYKVKEETKLRKQAEQNVKNLKTKTIHNGIEGGQQEIAEDDAFMKGFDSVTY